MNILETPNGPYVLIGRAGGRLLPCAADAFRKAALSGAELLYADESYLGTAGSTQPFYKPDWSPHTLLSCNYVGCPVAATHRLFADCGGMRLLPAGQEWNASDDETALYDFILRASQKANGVDHIPQILFQGPQPTTIQNAYPVLNALERAQHGGEAVEGLYPGSFMCRYGLQKDTRLAAIVRYDGDAQSLRRTLEQMESSRGTVPCAYIVVHEPVYEARVKRYLEALASSRAIVSVSVSADGNQARLFNAAADRAQADVLLFLPAGAFPQRVETLERMLTLSKLPDVGAVGGKLLDGEGRFMGGCLACGIDSEPVVLFSGYQDGTQRPLQNFYTNCLRDVTALTGVLAVASERFLSVGGFDETLPVQGYMEEFCVRMTDHHRKNLYAPNARWSGVSAKKPLPSKQNQERMQDVFFRFLREGDGMLTRNPSVLRDIRKARIRLEGSGSGD